MATPVDDDFLFKFILIGDSGVGKSSFSDFLITLSLTVI